ncbi:MAG: hypothetical protein ACW986_00725 [Promethearchaeota archaeon]|jgi:hypothetical protein
MLFQANDTLFFVLWLILATVIVTLILYIAVLVIVSKTKASDKKFLIILVAFLCVLVIPIILGAVNTVLSAIGNPIAAAVGSGNYLTLLTPIIGFLIILVMVKFLLDVAWDKAVWISLLTLFILFLLYTLLPGLAEFLGFTI